MDVGERIEGLITTLRQENREDHRDISMTLSKVTTSLALVCKRVEDLEEWRDQHTVTHDATRSVQRDSWIRRWGYMMALGIAVFAVLVDSMLSFIVR